MANLAIFGAGDIAPLAHYYFTRDRKHEVVAFTVAEKYQQGDTHLDLPLVAFVREGADSCDRGNDDGAADNFFRDAAAA